MPQVIPAVVAAISYVGSAATAVVAGTATLAQIATVAAVGIGAGVGGIAASKALTPEIGSQGAAVRWEANPDAPLRFAFGRVGVKGSIVDAAIYGPDRMYVSFACTVSAAGPIKRFVSFRAGDYYMTFDGAGAAVNEPYRGEMWLSTRLGAQPDTALSLPSGLKNGAAFPGWGSGRKLSGSACYLVTLGENSKRSAYEGKVPGFVTVIEGLFCYDPRQDSTYPGGSGACRLNNPATWVWTQNPILFALKWTLGLWEGPTGKGAPQVDYQVGGIGAKPESIILSTVVEAANVADANGWTSAAWPSTDDDKAQVLDGFLKAGGARYAEIAGRIAFIHRAAPRAPVFTIRARDTAGPVEIDTASSKLNRINTVRPRYWSEAHEWEMTALPEVTASEWQIEDGQGVAVKRTRGADYTFVDQPKQARELASLEISNSREGIRGRVPLRPYMDPEPGNAFIFDEPDFALSNLKCIVLEVEDNTENDTVVVTFETETDGKYPYAYGQTPSPPPAQELDPYDPTFVTPPLPGDWTVTPRPPAPGGGGLPSFDLTGVVSNSTATAIIVEYGPTAAGPWKQAYQGPPTVTNIPIEGLQPGATYYVAVQYQRNQNYSDRYVYGPYTAPLLDPSPTAPTIQAINDDIAAFAGDILDVSEDLAAARAQIEAQAGEIDDQAEAIGGIIARADGTDAAIIDLELAVAAEGTARAQAITEVSARSNTLPNIIANGDFRNGLSGFSQSGSAWIVGTEGGPGAAYAYCAADGQQDLWTPFHPVSSNLSFAYMAARSGAGVSLNLVVEWWNSSGGFLSYGAVSSVPEGDFQRIQIENDAKPPSADRFRILARKLGSGGNVAFTLLKVNTGAFATGWSDDADAKALDAAVTTQALAIIDLELQQSLAYWSVKAEASGGRPTILELLSGSFGNAIAMTAEQIYFGANTVFDDATDTLQTTVGGRIRVMALGAPFGASADLLEWWGPTGIALSAMSTINGYSGRMTSSPYVFDNVVAGASGSAAGRKESLSSSFPMGNTWSTVASITPTGVPASPFVSANVEWLGPPSTSDTNNWTGELRLIEVASGTVIGSPQPLFISHNNEPLPVAVDGPGLAAGAVQYALQARRTAGQNTVTAIGFAINFDAYQRL